VLTHDSVFTGCLDSVAFPEVGQLPWNRHVGQNEAAVIDTSQMVFSNKEDSQDGLQKFFILGQHLSGSDYLQKLLNHHTNVSCPVRHQLNSMSELNKRTIARYEKLLSEIDTRADKQGVQLDSEGISSDLYKAWVQRLFITNEKGVTHIGVTDSEVDQRLSLHAKLVSGAKFILVVRDPRDIAVEAYQYKQTHDPGFDRDGSQMNAIAKSTGEVWLQKVLAVQRYNKLNPGQIELVRYEDLVDPTKRAAALKRTLSFLGLDDSAKTVESLFESVGSVGEETERWKNALSLNQISLVELEAGPMMKLLQYPLSPHDHREIETDDTILPS